MKHGSSKDDDVNLARHILAVLRKQLDAAAAGLDAGGPDAARAVGRLTGLAYLKDRSVEAYSHSVRSDPSSAQARAGLALALLRADRFAEAVEQATILAGQEPAFRFETLLPGESVSALSLLGDALAGRGDIEAAQQAYRSALAASPKDTYAAGRLTQLLLQTAARSSEAVKEAVQIGKIIDQNPRFDQLSGVLRLAANQGVVSSVGSKFFMPPMPGRPFVVNGERRRGTVETSGGWETELTPDLGALGPAQRERIGEYWAAMGREEHAGVGSFARFVLQLLALGAPAALVQDAAQGMNDEIEHATLCFGLAAASLGRTVGVGALEIENCLEGSSDPWTILEATLVEGCVGETSSAAIAAEARRRCADPCIARVLDKIVAEESRHADLAWNFSAWMIETRPELAARAASVLATAASSHLAASDPAEDEGWDPALDAFGVLSPSESARQVRTAITEQVMPRSGTIFQGAELRTVG